MKKTEFVGMVAEQAGVTKKEAEQQAARAALSRMGKKQ